MAAGVAHGDLGALLGQCSSLVVGLVTPEGRPVATRAWAFDLDEGGREARVLLPSAEVRALGLPVDEALDLGIAVTGADVRTLASVQVKGRLRRLGAGTGADLARALRAFDGFATAVVETDGFDEALIARWMPASVHVAAVEVEEAYDQTPGPSAGRFLARFDG